VRAAGELVFFFGNLVLALIAIRFYPLLEDRAFPALGIAYIVLFAACLLAFNRPDQFPSGTPVAVRVAFLAGLALSLDGLCLGVVVTAATVLVDVAQIRDCRTEEERGAEPA
jgi:hypothetical protein